MKIALLIMDYLASDLMKARRFDVIYTIMVNQPKNIDLNLLCTLLSNAKWRLLDETL